jgi:hypothetical protein
MRLVLASTILASTLPVVSSLALNDKEISPLLTAHLKNDGSGIEEFVKKRKGSGYSMLRMKQKERGRKLKNLANSVVLEKAPHEECNPKASSVPNGTADIGILSCGSGRYCVESEESTLGGFCVDDHHSFVSRSLQGNTTVIENMAYACQNTATNGCTCTGVDVASYTGSITCPYGQYCVDAPNVCGDNVTVCYSSEYSLSVSAPDTGTAERCYSFTEPTSFSYCYKLFAAVAEAATCEMQIDGALCSTCTYNTTDGCKIFDCTNTPFEYGGNSCDYSVPELEVSDYLLYNFLPCPGGCSICGDSRVVSE